MTASRSRAREISALAAVLIAGCLTLPVVAAEAVVSDLRVCQSLQPKDGVYVASPQILIQFKLTADAPVKISIERHQNEMLSFNGPYLVDTFPVRTLDLGSLKAGEHVATWDGLDAAGKEVTYIKTVPVLTIIRENRKDPAKFVETVRAELFKIVVQTPTHRAHANYRRIGNAADPNRQVATAVDAVGCVTDAGGDIVFPCGGRVYRYSPAWTQKVMHIGASQSSDPIEASDVAVDSHGDVYVVNHAGVYRFKKEGPAGEWTANEDYVNYPYPSNFRTLLGVALDPASRGKKRQYVLGPGGNGHYKHWDTAEMLGKPGFSLRWTSVAIDAQDNVYVGSQPGDVQVFDNTGKHLRTLRLPEKVVPNALRVIGDTLWVTSDNGTYMLKASDGSVIKRVTEGSFRRISVDKAGRVYIYSGVTVLRVDSTGQPLSFSPKSPHRTDQGNVLSLGGEAHKAPAGASGFLREIGLLQVAEDGSFHVAERQSGRLLRFSAEGIYQPLPVTMELGQHDPGNVFLDRDPAQLDLAVTSFDSKPQELVLDWILWDFEGRTQQGRHKVTLSTAARQTVPLVVPATENGHYRLQVEARCGGQLCGTLTTSLARIAKRTITEDRYSPFAVVWTNNFALSAYAGAKSHRGDSASWAWCFEPQDGLFYPDRQDGQNYTEGVEGPRQYARRWGIQALNGLDYGEAWLGNHDLISRLWSYDRFYGYCLHAVDAFSGKGEAFYQFWNEPNFFWHVGGPFGREHFGLVTKHVWSIVKARDKEAMLVSDGDAGGIGMMEEFARFGVAPYNDTLQFHYPGAQPVKFDQIVAPGAPEGKMDMCERLLALRDKSFPGKQVWNTEEGYWGAQIKTPTLGAVVVPRTYIPQLAAGVDKIYWFALVSPDDPAYLLNDREEPYPAYASYAAMSLVLDRATYAGRLDLGSGNFAFLFARGDQFVLAAWRVQGQTTATLAVGVAKAAVTDLMGRRREVQTKDGKLTLALTERVQYVELPRNEFTLGIARQQLQALLAKAGVATVKEIEPAATKAASTAATDAAAMNQLYWLVKAAESAVISGSAPATAGKADAMVTATREAVRKAEGQDGYLRQARTALEWPDRLATRPLLQGNTWAVKLAADAVAVMAAKEQPCYPGVVINAFIGEPGEVARIRAIVPKPNDHGTTIDDKFRFQIDRAPGQTLELELTVWNYYRHKIEGTLTPRLPQGWAATPGETKFAIEPGKFQRVVVTVTLPKDATPGVYSIGGQCRYSNQPITEIHPQRVRVP